MWGIVRCSGRLRSYSQALDQAVKTARDKHSSLLAQSVIMKEKCFLVSEAKAK